MKNELLNAPVEDFGGVDFVFGRAGELMDPAELLASAQDATMVLKGKPMARVDGPITVCVINLKGGVGKSTISALLARHAYTRWALDVLAIDLDPQANLSQGLMHNGYNSFLIDKRPSIVEVFNGYLPPNRKGTASKPLPVNSLFETIAQDQKKSLQLIPSRFDFSDNLLGAVRSAPTPERSRDSSARTSSTRIS